jgi:phosphonate transport system substrate-binding protein
VTTLRVHSFLGEVLRPHFAAVSQLVAEAAGYDVAELDEPGLDGLDRTVAAPGPALLFLCGLPYTRLHDAGAPIEAIAGAVPQGEPGPCYFSAFVVRDGLEARSAADLVGLRVGLNGRDSLSGYVLPHAELAGRGLGNALYDHAIETGSHRRSLDLLVAGELDAAGIDSTMLPLEARDDPAVGALRVLERLGPAPVPPVVLLNGGPELARALRAALVGLAEHDAGRRALALGLVERFAEVEDADYDVVRAMDRELTEGA